MAAEAFLLQLTKSGLEGDGAAARASLAMIEQARERHGVGQRELFREKRCRRQSRKPSKKLIPIVNLSSA